MRVEAREGDFKAKAIAGTNTILIALDCKEGCRHGLLGFAFKRETVGSASSGTKWLRSQKVFKSIVPNPKLEHDPDDPSKPKRFSCYEHPIQSFLWSDYSAYPDTLYKFTIVPMYGQPGALRPETGISFEVKTEKELDKGHGIWFNRGSIASQAFTSKFQNQEPPEPENTESPQTAWLSRGLLEACLKFINDARPNDGLRVAAYEFTYKPFIVALKNALDRGVDVRIIYHDTTEESGENGANENAINNADLPATKNGNKVLYPRTTKTTKINIPHNKFIIWLRNNNQPAIVWTGSTNFTPSGFLGQSNVGHLVEDAETAAKYLEYWELLKDDPHKDTARAGTMNITPNPPALIPANSIVKVFSPRPRSELLKKWYGKRIEEARGTVMFTAAFGIHDSLIGPLAKDRDFLRFILMEKPLNKAKKAALTADRDLIISYGSILGQMYKFKNGKPTARKKIKEFELDKWLLKEDHYRHAGHVFFVHTKFLLIDPLSNDPLICSGSANFSPASLLSNDENMLLIRGDKRVADIYLTEFDRIFRHFYFRMVANEIEAKGGKAKGAFLDETSDWTDSYFTPGWFKTRRREMFFADPDIAWSTNTV